MAERRVFTQRDQAKAHQGEAPDQEVDESSPEPLHAACSLAAARHDGKLTAGAG